MASIQSAILRFSIRRMNIFGSDQIDLVALRESSENAGPLSKAHKNVQMLPVIAGTVPAEWLIPPRAKEDCAILYLHGGAWFMGSTNTHRALVSELAFLSGVRALSINYRLVPEHPFPAGLEDCLAAYEWLQQSGIPASQIVVAGDSAGGNLTLALLIALRDNGKPMPAGAVALSPVTDLANTGESHKTRAHLDPYFAHLGANNPIFPAYITTHDPREPLISPLYADLHGLPPLLLHVGEHEKLYDDTIRFGKAAITVGVQVKLQTWPKMFHVFQIYTPFLPEARQANRKIAAFIVESLDTEANQS